MKARYSLDFNPRLRGILSYKLSRCLAAIMLKLLPSTASDQPEAPAGGTSHGGGEDGHQAHTAVHLSPGALRVFTWSWRVPMINQVGSGGAANTRTKNAPKLRDKKLVRNFRICP